MTFRLRLRGPVDRHDELAAELWTLGTLGVEFGSDGQAEVLDAYFETPPEVGSVGAVCERYGGNVEAIDEVVDEDWHAAYRERVTPRVIGLFWIDAREPSASEPPGGLLSLRVPARNAFGTGSHESTALVIDWLSEVDVAGSRVLDVGCGSGILSLAVLRLEAAAAVGFDIDGGSALTAATFARLNSLAASYFAGTIEALGDVTFDLALVNVLPERWLSAARAVVERVRPGGEILTSGLLTEQQPAVTAALVDAGCVAIGERHLGEWAALRLERVR